MADLEHGEAEERWFSVGCAVDGAILSVVYVWHEIGQAMTKIRLISARRATRNETRFYEENL
ncbi:MAG TPA: BrnT family toxin [Terriglobia bacterium]|nr:BrnT family toxin [Terriglobia bacterium]